jgi:phospholipase C
VTISTAMRTGSVLSWLANADSTYVGTPEIEMSGKRATPVSNVICDHTSVLATIESKWNLPALSNRDANAATVMDFLDLSTPALLNPPPLQEPSKTGPSGPLSKSA